MESIVSALILYIQAFLGFADIDLSSPRIEIIYEPEMRAVACPGAPRCDVLGWFSNHDEVIYLRDDQDVVNDMYARSVLLHELVHYVQHRTRILKYKNTCVTWKAREAQAHYVQRMWLHEHRVPHSATRFGIWLANFYNMRCPRQEVDMQTFRDGTEENNLQ